MIVSERILKWAMRLYPPFFFQRIWVKKFEKDFRGVEVKISKSIFNRNYNSSIFGGTIFSATDPFYAVLYDQVLQRKGYRVRVWLKGASINYLKPGRTNLYFRINLSDSDIEEAEHALITIGKFIKSYPMDITDVKGVVCASVINEVYIRNLHKGEENSISY